MNITHAEINHGQCAGKWTVCKIGVHHLSIHKNTEITERGQFHKQTAAVGKT